MSVNVSQAASLTINGISTTGGVGLSLLAAPALAAANVTRGDYFAETFTVNPLTAATARPLGEIVSANTLWMQTDIPVDITLTQNAVDYTFTVDSFVFMNTSFTAIKLANNDATTAANINLVVVGDRTPNTGTPGIY